METHTNCKCSEFKLDRTDDNLYSAISKKDCQLFNVTNSKALDLVLREESLKYHFDHKIHFLESHKDDPELLIDLRFREEIKLRAINIIAKPGAVLNELNIYINEENVDFDIIEEEPFQKFECDHFTPKGEMEVYPNIKMASNVRALVIHLKSDDYSSVGIHYIGIKGINTKAKRGIVKTDYEILNVEKQEMNPEMIAKQNKMIN